MLKLIIGNKAYSSWSMRGGLAVRQAGLPYEEIVVPMFGEEWNLARAGGEFAPSSGKVPILWDDDVVVWDSLAIIEYLAEKGGSEKFWPADAGARAMARSMAAEMHSSFMDLRRGCPMNVRKRFPAQPMPAGVLADTQRVLDLWMQARARFGGTGDFLFGDFGAADIMFAPVVTRFVTYAIPLPRFAALYASKVLLHPHVRDWIEAAQDEPWVIEKYEIRTPG